MCNEVMRGRASERVMMLMMIIIMMVTAMFIRNSKICGRHFDTQFGKCIFVKVRTSVCVCVCVCLISKMTRNICRVSYNSNGSNTNCIGYLIKPGFYLVPLSPKDRRSEIERVYLTVNTHSYI